MLNFKPHPQEPIPNVLIAKHNGYSVIHGGFVNGYEIMDPHGDVQSGFTLKEAERFIRDGLFHLS